jgi:2-polyprenyl-6-methoxyphenol hydroxylase-like FAD-dependent oxidoreductase
MSPTKLDCQVLVVGAGPTGLVLAAELLSRGIRTRIIDKGDGVSLQTRATAMAPNGARWQTRYSS